MSSCKLVIKDEVNVKFENLDLKWRQRLHNKFKYQVPYAFHLPSVKLGRWDGHWDGYDLWINFAYQGSENPVHCHRGRLCDLC